MKVVFGFVFYITSATQARVLLRLNRIIHTKWKTYITHDKVFARIDSTETNMKVVYNKKHSSSRMCAKSVRKRARKENKVYGREKEKERKQERERKRKNERVKEKR